MLTKEERAAITERLKGINFLTDNEIYKAITGKCVSVTTTYNEDIKRVIKAVLGLCDTSNMIELPCDKDGEVIHISDTVYDNDGNEVVVDSLRYCAEYGCVVICTTCNGFICTYSGDGLTHKKPVTIASLVGEIRRTLSQNTIMNKEATSKLWEITDQIEMLGDSDD